MAIARTIASAATPPNLLEKYKSMARDLQLAGDRVQTEYYLQYADHYYRVLGESRARFDEQRRQRGEDDGDEESDDEMMEAGDDDRPVDAAATAPSARRRAADRRTSERSDGPSARIAMSAVPATIGPSGRSVRRAKIVRSALSAPSVFRATIGRRVRHVTGRATRPARAMAMAVTKSESRST